MAALLVTLPCTAGRMCFVCHLTSVLNGCRLCSYVCQIHLSTWKCWKTHSSPVFDKSYNTNVLAHTSTKKKIKGKKRRKRYPLIFKNSSQKHFKQACFITTIIIVIMIIIIVQYKPTWSINNQKNRQTENTLLQHIIQGLLSCDVNYLYYNSSTSAKFVTIEKQFFFFGK